MRTKDFKPGQYLYGIQWHKDGSAEVIKKKIVHVGNKNIQVMDECGEEEYTITPPDSDIFTQKIDVSLPNVLYPNIETAVNIVAWNNLSKEIKRAVTTDAVNRLTLDQLQRIKDIIAE